MKTTHAREHVASVVTGLQGTLFFAIAANLGRANITDRAMTLAGQAFTSILPVMIVMTSIPVSGPIEHAMDRITIQWLELDPNQPLTAGPATASFGVLGALMTIIGATSFSRALDRMYAEAWGTPKLGIAGWWRWPLVIGAIVAGITVEVFLVRSWPYSSAMAFETILSALLWAPVWAAITRLLTAGRIPGQAVLATGGAIGVAVSLYFLATQIGFSRILANAETRFSTLGVVFVVIGWLFVYSWIVVGAVVVTQTVMTWRDQLARNSAS
ncbi:hypothetical protein [Gordonia sp. (in: high G+C Gram-positive bacteria)]|uniref:hypothetical protein n=1 Tax=Gordonia sp. (in: high G+C Gram-positive bacteria) TaxID=84139 RepID=UPI003527CE9E